MNFDNLFNSPAFVIHVPNLSPERKDFFSKNIKNAGYNNIIIFNGVNGYDNDEVNNIIKMYKNIKFDNYMSKGMIGCFLSHIKLYSHIIKNKIPISTIFEDDIYFHSDWNRLAPLFYENTPKDFDLIFMGNQIENCVNNKSIPRIHNISTFCTHAYVITYNGAIKLLNLILNWDYNTKENEIYVGHSLTGLTAIDIIIKNIQDRINQKKMKKILTWYCWNGTKNKCNHPKSIGYETRNTGLVFQSCEFKSIIK